VVRRKSPLLPRGWASCRPRTLLICLCVWNRDTSTRPPQVTNPIGTLLLGHIEPDGSGGLNLDVGQLIELNTRPVIRSSHDTSPSA
jgi:hypothetical protein